MEDKRKQANEELRDTFGAGLLALKPEEPQNFVELPKPEETTQQAQGNVLNNFNVNVNVQGGSQGNAAKIASEAINKALPTGSEKPEDVKKNSQESLIANSAENSKNKSLVLPSLQETKQEQDYIEIPDSIGPTIPALDLAGLGLFDSGDAAEYDYSTSRLKEENAATKMTYQILKNVTQHSMQSQSSIEISPSSNIDTTMIVEEIAGARKFLSVSQLNVENNTNQNIQTVNELSRQKQNDDRMMTQQTNKSIKTLTKQNSEQVEQEDDIQEATSVSRKEGNGAVATNFEKPKKMPHLNPYPSTIDMFKAKANSPPFWRTVYG